MKGYEKNNEFIEWHETHYNTTDINDKLIINLRDLSHVMRFLYEGKGSQKRILIILNEIDSSITQRELTERLGIQPGSASEVIAKLESAKYIRRSPSETDRRTTNIELTKAGKTAALKAKEQRVRRHEQMFSCLSDTEKTQLLSLLEKVNMDWKKRYQDMGQHYRHHEHHHKEMHCQKGE